MSSAVKPLTVSLEVDSDDDNETTLEELQAKDTFEPIPFRYGTRSNFTAPPLPGKF